MQKTQEKLAKSLTADTIELIPYLPYLLQDIWELGSSPRIIVDLIKKHIITSSETKVLDLACGKGAISIQIAQIFGCHVKSFDLIPDFIEYAKTKSLQYHVEKLCEFIIGDISDVVHVETDFDIVIFGAAGDIFGNPEETILQLKRTIKSGGYIIIDDVYGNVELNGKYPTRKEWFHVFQNTGVKLLEDRLSEIEEIKRINDKQQLVIKQRASELIKKYPDKADMFKSYVKSQQIECNKLEYELTGVTMLLRWAVDSD